MLGGCQVMYLKCARCYPSSPLNYVDRRSIDWPMTGLVTVDDMHAKNILPDSRDQDSYG